MKCLSVRQPWAQLIVDGHKDVENRTWRTGHRGPILIHAGLRLEKDAAEYYAEQARQNDVPWPETLLKGGIIGVVELVDCVASHPSEWYDPDSIAWVLANASPLPFLPWKGRLGLFDVPDEVLAEHFRLHGIEWEPTESE